MTKLLNVRMLLFAALTLSIFAAAIPVSLSVFELAYLRDSLSRINQALTDVKQTRDIVDKIGQSIVGFTAVTLDMSEKDRSKFLAETDRQVGEFDRAIERINRSATNFLSDRQRKALADALASLAHSWGTIRNRSAAEISVAEKTFHFLQILEDTNTARDILVTIEAAATRMVENETQFSVDRLTHAGTLLIWIMAIGAVVSIFASLGIYDFAQATRKVNAQLEERDRKLNYMAHHDALTNLPNRSLFHLKMEQALVRVREGGEGLAVLYLDLDGFKSVNDTLGHPVGDALLRLVAQRLRECTGGNETAARLGGDEFAILHVTSEPAKDAAALARRIIEVIGAPYHVDDHLVVIGTSLGIALAPTDGVDADQLMKNADMALYHAKSSGRGTFHFFQAEMDTRAHARRSLELALREALVRNEFELLYQPMINLADNTVSGCEALLRWHHPERGIVAPTEFIPLAEEIGLINPLGEWVIRQACAAAAKWPADIGVAVNLSPAQFKSRRLLQVIVNALAGSGLPANRLELEITESILLHETDATLATLHQLRGLGVRVSLDDFGTGYSSLSYLRRFPFDKIKIDRSFIKELFDHPNCMAIVRAITSLGRSLGMVTTAEGVETPEQLELVRGEGCAEAQGSLLSRPRSEQEIAQLLVDRARGAEIAA